MAAATAPAPSLEAPRSEEGAGEAVAPAGELLERVRALHALTTEQLAAARSMQVLALAELNLRREELVFDIQLLVDEDAPIPPTDQEELSDLCTELIALEERLVRVSKVALSLVGESDHDTYDRSGRVVAG